jgi:hypothetical protein
MPSGHRGAAVFGLVGDGMHTGVAEDGIEGGKGQDSSLTPDRSDQDRIRRGR